MVEESERSQNPWMKVEQLSRLDISNSTSLVQESTVAKGMGPSQPQPHRSNPTSDGELGVPLRIFSAAGSAVLSAIILNPLDVVKTRLQAQAAGAAYSHPLSNITSRMAFFGPNMMFADLRCSPSCARAGIQGTVSICPPDCFQYKGTLDVFYKIIRQEGFARLWRGTNAALAIAVPTVGIYLPCYDIFRNKLMGFTSENIPSLNPFVPAVASSLARSLACITCYPVELARTRVQAFKELHHGKKLPGVCKTLVEIVSGVDRSSSLWANLQNCRVLWTGLGAQLARDVPFSAIYWSTAEAVKRPLLKIAGDQSSAATVLAANFSSGFVAGSFAAACTCPLDVAKTRRQIEKDPLRALRMTTRQTLVEVWRDGGMKGLFTGVGPRIARAGPSSGIVLSVYEVMKYFLHHHYAATS